MSSKVAKLFIFLSVSLILANVVSAQVYGDGSDGDITRTSSGSESGIIQAQSYTIQSGVTRTVSGSVVIHATDKITIDGTLTSTSNNRGSRGSPRSNGNNGGSGKYIDGGGAGGSSPSGSDGDGNPGNEYGGAGGGGWGACGGGERGGNGGNGGTNTDTIPSTTQTSSISGSTYLGDRSGWSELYNLPSNIGAGGGGGGGGGESEQGNANNYGGHGGDGGGMIILVAPEIEITGNVYSRGEDGQDGEGVSSSTSCSPGGGGGGGGGGAGGLIYLVSETLTETGTVSVAGGNGGDGQSSSGWAHEGGYGASGQDGELYRISAPANEAPNAPNNPSPSDTQDTVNADPTLYTDVSDPDGDSMDIRFYTSGGSLIGIDSSVCSGCTASVSWNDRNTGTSYSWYAVADDGEATTQSSTWSFTTIHEPNSPTNPSPNNDETDISVGSVLSIGEAGRSSGLSGSSWVSESFNRNFDNAPHVFATTQTTNGGQDPSEAHVRNVDINGFETQHCEFENTDSCTGHNSEINGWFAVDASDIDQESGWETGILTVNSGSGDYEINYDLSTDPLLFATPQTMNGEPSLNTRFHSVSSSGATLSFCEQDGPDSCDSSHVDEDVAWLALDPSQISEKDGFEYGRFTMSDSSWEDISFNQNFDVAPIVIADVQSKNDDNEALYAEVNNVNTEGAQVRFCESNAGNNCDTHAAEEVAWMAISPAALGATVSHPDGLDMDVAFRINDGSGWSTVDTDNAVADGETASASPDLDLSESYDWRAEASASGYSTESNTWSFSTEHNVGLNSISGPSATPAPLNPQLEATISHSDSNRGLTAEFVNDDTGTTLHTMNNVNDGQTVTYDPSGDSFGSSTGTTYNWRVELSGSEVSESYTSASQSFTTVSAPSVTLDSPNPGEERVSTDADLVANVDQAEGLQLNTVITLEDDQGNFVDDYSVNSGNGEVRFSNPNLQLSENYQWYADTSIIDSTYSRSDNTETRSFSTAHNISANILNPSDGASVVGVESTLQAEVQHSDPSRTSTVTFYDDSDGSILGQESGLTDGDVAEFDTTGDNFGSQTGTTYSWYLQVDDGQGDSDIYTSNPTSFTTIYAPNSPFNGAPTGSATALDTGLDVDVAQQDGEQMLVDFYVNDTLEGTVSSGPGAASLPTSQLDLDEGTEYAWYAKVTVTDEHSVEHTATSNVWNFETVHKPEVTDVSPARDEKNVFINSDLDFNIRQEDGRSMDIQVFDANTGDRLYSDTGASSGSVKATTDSQDFASQPNTTYEWYAVVEEPMEGLKFNNSDNPWSFTTVATPEKPVDPEPFDEASEADVNTTLSVYVDHEDINTVDVLFFNEDTGNELGRDEDVSTGSRAELKINEDFTAGLDQEDQEFGSEFDTDYAWYAVAVADGATIESDVFNYTTIRPGNVIETIRSGDGNMNPGNGSNGREVLEVKLTHDQGEVIDEAIFTDGSGTEIYTAENITSGESASFNISEHWTSNIVEDSSYDWNLEVRNKEYTIGQFSESFNTYTNYLSWDAPVEANQDHYAVYHATADNAFNYGEDDYTLVGRPYDSEFVDANMEINEGQNCYRVVSVNIGGESDPVPLNQGECINVN